MMESRILPRLGAVCGVLYVVLTLVGNSIYEAGNETVGLPTELAGMLLFVPFLGYLYSVLRRAEGENGWLSTTAFGAGLMELMNGASFNLSRFPFAVLAAAVATVTLQTRVLPAWIGWMGVVTVPALLVNAMFFFAESITAFLIYLLWLILLSAVLTWRAGKVNVERSIPISHEPARVR